MFFKIMYKMTPFSIEDFKGDHIHKRYPIFFQFFAEKNEAIWSLTKAVIESINDKINKIMIQ